MSSEDPEQKTPADVQPEPIAHVPRSGSGAGTALTAMLKKRQMRAKSDAENSAPEDGAKKPGSE